MPREAKESISVDTPVAKEMTINLKKRLHGITFKKRAPRAIREIKAFAGKEMKTSDVRVDTTVNKFVWHKGVRNVPYRIRIRLERKRNQDEDAAETMYTLVSLVESGVPAKGSQTAATQVLAEEE